MDQELARLRAVFDEALQASPERRKALIHERCGEDAALQRRIEALIATAEADSPFLAQPTRDRLPACAATLVRTEPLTEGPGTCIGSYKLLQQIGEGGFGVVFMAAQERPIQRRVALKIIKLGMDTRAIIARFEAERQALALMDHPNIAKVLDAGATDTGRPYFVMELVKGVPITEYCDANNLSATERLDLFVPVCRAVQHAHQKGIIHRDIKPSNILVTMHDGQPVPKVIDFGIAKATSARLTEKTIFTEYRALIGTPAYMSPEQAEMSELDVDTRTDIYALGVLLYELLTGTTPFDAKDLMRVGYAEIQRIIREVEPPKPSTRVSTLGERLTSVAAHRRVEPRRLGILLRGDLDWVVMKALEKDRTRRYDTANDLATDVQRHLSGEAVLAAPPSSAYRLRKFIRRHRGPVAAGVIVTAALVLGLAGTGTQMISAMRAEHRADLERDAANAARAAAERASIAAETARQAEAEAAREALAHRDEAEHEAYVANVFAAASDPYSARERLDACPEHLRGWEWKYLKASTDTSLYSLAAGSYRFVRFSPDGARFITNGTSNNLEIRETATGRLLSTGPKQWGVNEACFSPDGQRILLCGVNHETDGYSAEVYDPATGRLVATRKFDDSPRAFFFPDGSRFITNSANEPIQVWETRTGTLVTTLGDSAQENFGDCSFSPDGQRLAVVSAHGAEVWSTASVKRLLALGEPNESMGTVRFSPDGSRILTLGAGSHVRIWDASSGVLHATLNMEEATEGKYTEASFSPDGRGIITWIKSGRTVRVWDALTSTLLTTITCSEHDAWFDAILSPDGSRILTTGGPTPHVWDVRTGRFVTKLSGHARDVRHAAFSPDGSTIIATAYDGALRVWDANVSPNPVVFRVPRAPDDPSLSKQFDSTVLFEQSCLTTGESPAAKVWLGPGDSTQMGVELQGCVSVAFSPDGKRLLHTALNSVFVWDLETNRKAAEFCQNDVFNGYVYIGPHAVFLGEGAQVLSWGRTAQVWDAATGTRTLLVSHPSIEACRDQLHSDVYAAWSMRPLIHAAASDDGSRILTVFGMGTRWSPETGRGQRLPGATLWLTETATGRRLLDLECDTGVWSCAALSPDGSLIAVTRTTGDAEVCRLLDAKTGEERHVLPLRGAAIGHPAFSPDSSRLVSASVGLVQLWDTRSGRELANVSNRDSWIPFAEFSRDGARVVIATGNGATLLDAKDGRAISELMGHTNEITAAAFSPDGSRIVTCSYDQTVRVWETATGKALVVYRENAPTDGADESYMEIGFSCVAFSPDGRRLAAGTVDGRVLIFHSAPHRELNRP